MNFYPQERQPAAQTATKRLVQAGWSLFAVFSLSLGVAGIPYYRQLLTIPCTGSNCFPGQITPSQVAILLPDYWSSLAERGQVDTFLAILISVLLVGCAGIFVWRHPEQVALVLGGFVFLALAAEPFVEALSKFESQWLWAARLLAIIHLSILAVFLGLIPDGRFRPQFLRFPLGICAVLGILIPLADAPPSLLPVGYSILVIAAVAMTMVARLRKATDPAQHEQLVWIAVAMILLGAAQIISPPLVLLPLPGLPAGTLPALDWATFSFVGSAIVAVGAVTCLMIGLMRNEVFQLELILNRTMLYAILTLFVIGVYITVVGFLSLLFQSSDHIVFSLIATGVVAVLFQPVRAWAHRFVNQMLYGERDQPYVVLDQLGKQLENVLAPQDILQMVVSKVRKALKLPYAAVTLRLHDQQDFQMAAADGIAAGSPLILPLMVQGEQIGQFILSPRTPGESFSTTDHRFLADLAEQVAIAAHTAILMMELQRAREQLIYSREEERRHLRRDLHDGLGTSLAALNLQVGRVRKLFNTEPDKVDGAILELRTQLQGMIAEVRGMINDLRPKALDEFGLFGAINLIADEVMTASDLQVVTDLPANTPPELPAAVEVATFRIVQEGLANVIKHSGAKNCTVRLISKSGLTIEILDDGIGLPVEVVEGKGLGTIRERAQELGGRCSAESRPAGGSRIVVWLPIYSFEDRGSPVLQD